MERDEELRRGQRQLPVFAVAAGHAGAGLLQYLAQSAQKEMCIRDRSRTTASGHASSQSQSNNSDANILEFHINDLLSLLVNV